MRSWIAFLLCISVEIAAVSQKEVIVTMQTKRWTHILNDHFLSLTVTPEIALQLEDFSKTTMNMMKGLSPTMVRLGGPSTDKMKFVPEKFTTDNFTITEAQWKRLNQFIEDVNMHLIVCLNSKDRVHGVWESHDAVELIYSSDKNRYKLGWELGYESEKLQQDGVSGSQLGRDVARLKKILGDFPMYTDSPIIGPDMKSLSSPEQVRFLREYLEESADFLTAITWHPQFSSTNPEDEDVGHKFLKIIHEMDNQIWNRNNGLRSPIQPPPKKPIWLAESDNDEYTGKFADSLTWMKRLGAAARLGFPVIMKKMTATSLTTPTPDYWVSLLYKTLVGPAVMDVKYFAGTNRSSLQVFSHCAHVGDESGGVLPPNLRYTQGATVLYGLNLDDQETRLTVRGNMKEEAVHKYVLTAAQLEEEKEFSDEEEEEKLIRKKRPSPQKTLLNGKLLSLLPSGELPTISPIEMRPTRTLSFNIPERSVFFFVLPDMKLKTCMSFTSTIQSPIEKVNTLEKGLNLKSSNLGSEEGPKLNFGNNILEPRISNEGPKLNFAPVGNNNILESRLSNDVVNGEPWKPPSFGVGLRGRLPDGRLNRGLIGVPKPRVVLESSNRHGTIDRENVLQDHSSTYNLKPMGKTTENEEDFDKEGTENDMELITDNGRAITNTRFVMFSDDDWLSDFAKAQESVELARKAIAAFDEAKLYRDQQQESLKLPQNSFEERIMNQKMSPARRRIYEALMKKNTSKEFDQGLKNSAVFINGSDDSKDEKVYNRERRDNMIHESTFQSIEESSAIDNKLLKSGSDNKTDNQTEYTTSNIIPNLKSNNTVNTTSNIMPISKSNDTGYKTSNIMSLIRSNDIVKITPIQNNRTLEETPNVNNSSIVKPLKIMSLVIKI
ncbi:uncharacterized protein LOC111051805 [Nilaparvata lugens]|uniref:uncharacterized protein LOC111051805 n=1 Tax=Nilaparvata lugens TaxID=108931 RepID=UPI00193D03CC|nr:uncharacterized protein LOC111051805 [Nilaparvata lugens]